MASRIRYVGTDKDGVLVSKQHFIHPENGSKYKVVIDEPNLSFEVLEDLTGKVVCEGSKVNLHQVKQAAKEKLMELGISFEEEKRKVKLNENQS